MALTSQDIVLKLVTGMFGAAPGAAYLREFTASVDAGGYEQLAVALGNTGTFQSLYPAAMGHKAFAQSFLGSLVPGFDMSIAAHASAADLVTVKLNSGEPVGQVVLDVLVLLNGIRADDPTWGAARQQWDQRVEAAKVYSVDLGISSSNLAELQDALHAPQFAGAQVNGGSLTLSYHDLNLLDPFLAPVAGNFAVTVGGVARGISAVKVNPGAGTITLTLDVPVTAGQVVTVGYTDPSAGNDFRAIQDLVGNDAASLAATAVNNVTPDTTPPVFASATVNGATLVLTYTELTSLDAIHPPAVGAFAVAVAGVARTVSGLSVDANAKTVTLTLATAVVSGESVTVAYTDPTASNDSNALQDISGNDAASLAATAVTNITPDITPPVFANAVVTGASLVLTYTEANLLDAAHPPPLSAFEVTVAGLSRTVTAVTVDAEAKTVTLTLASGAIAGQAVTVAYTDPTSRDNVNAIQDATGNDAASLPSTEVTNNTADVAPPVLASATVNGSTLVLTYTDLNPLDAANPPAAGDFAVQVAGVPNTVSAVSVNASARTVTLTLATAVANGQAVTVAYTDPTAGNDTKAIQDNSGNDALSLDPTPVTNNTAPDTTPPAFKTAAVDGDTLVLTYTDQSTLDGSNIPDPSQFVVTVINSAGPPKSAIAVGGTAVTVNEVSVDASARTVTLTLATAVANGQAVTVAYTDPTAENDSNAIQDNNGNDAESLAATSVKNNTPDTTPPVFASATVNGVTLVLTYSELNLLDPANAPLVGAFDVTVGAGAVTVAAVSVDVKASTVTLTLATAVANGQAVTVAYTDPTAGNDTKAIQDNSGNDAESLAATSVKNNTPPAFKGATVDGDTLVLTYTASTLDDVAIPDLTQFAVTVAGELVTVHDVSVNAADYTVTLTLAAPVVRTDEVMVAYMDPSEGDDEYAIQDGSGNDAASLEAALVANNTPEVKIVGVPDLAP